MIGPGIGPAHLCLAFQRGNEPDSSILTWIFVFIVVVWPILRGMLQAANERRRKFLEEQARAGRAARRGRGPGDPTSAGPASDEAAPADPFEMLKRLLTGQVEAQDAPSAPPPRRVVTPSAPSAPSAPGAPVQRPEVAGESGLGGELFDDLTLDEPLVADPELAHVPSEGGRPTETPGTHAPAHRKSDFKAPDRVPEPSAEARSAMRAAGTAARTPLARVARRVRSPWGQAVLYEELLGPPAAMREPRF